MTDTILRLASADLLFPLIVIVVIVVINFFHKKEVLKQKENLKQQALKRNGKVQKEGLVSFPRLAISESGSDVLVYSTPGGKNSPPHTHFTSDVQSPRNYKVKLCREYRIFGIGTVFGQDIKVNYPDFDEAYVIQGSDKTIVRELLTHEVQAKLLEIKDHNPVLEFNKNKLKLFISCVPKDEQQYDLFIDAGLLILKRIKEMG